MKKIIIIGDSLTNDFAGPEERFLSNPVNVGKSTIDRVFGKDEEYGKGPLVEFLKSAQIAKKTGNLVDSILVRDLHDPNNPLEQHELSRYGNHNIIGTDGADFVSIIRDYIDNAFIINTNTFSIPTKIFHDVMFQILQQDVLSLTEKERENIVFVLCGFYTNIRIKNTAEKLRHDYGFQNVLVSPHLTGSRDHASHLHTLQADLPNSLIKVIGDLPDIWEMTFGSQNIDQTILSQKINILPKNILESLSTDQKEIIKSLFLLNDQIELKILSGGYSGSILFLAQGRIDGNKTEPSVIKIDKHSQMYKEIFGYNLVKEYLGKNIPTFAVPISSGSLTGVKMELASMNGLPKSLQQYFEEALNAESLDKYLVRLKNTLEILKNKLYKGKLLPKKIYPYRELGLHIKMQLTFLHDNIGHIVDLKDGKFSISNIEFEIEDFVNRFEKLTSNVDRIDGETTLIQGDLNLANIISDNNENIWLIDWTHTQESLVELDFAKMENDIKYVISKNFSEDDIDNFSIFEDFLLSIIKLPEINKLPQEMQLLLKDFKFLKLYLAIKNIRDCYIDTKTHSNEILYKITLLKYSTHTLSFDKSRGRGECDKNQLYLALIGTHKLMSILEKDTFHSSVPLHKAKNYPKRYVVPEEKKSWQEPFEEYNPPYYSNQTIKDGYTYYGEASSIFENIQSDNNGIPLNPTGRTGIAGRGDLYYWGANLVVDPVIARKNTYNGKIEILLVKRKKQICGKYLEPSCYQMKI